MENGKYIYVQGFKENVLVDSKKHIWKVYFEEDVKINYRHFLITLLQQTNES